MSSCGTKICTLWIQNHCVGVCSHFAKLRPLSFQTHRRTWSWILLHPQEHICGHNISFLTLQWNSSPPRTFVVVWEIPGVQLLSYNVAQRCLIGNPCTMSLRSLKIHHPRVCRSNFWDNNQPQFRKQRRCSDFTRHTYELVTRWRCFTRCFIRCAYVV